MINRIYWTWYGKFVVVFNYQTYEFDDEDEAEDWFGKDTINEYYLRDQNVIKEVYQ